MKLKKKTLILIILCALLAAAVAVSAVLLYYGLTDIADAYRLETDEALRIARGEKKELKTDFIITDHKKAPHVLKKLNRTEVFFESDDESVVSVDEQGRITGIKSGEAHVSVSCGSLNAVCTVGVYVPLEGIEFTESSLRLNTGDSGKFEIRTVPAEAEMPEGLTFRCDREDLLYVTQSGYYTVKKSGKTDVKASVVQNGRTFTAVLNAEIMNPLKNLKLNEQEISLVPGDSYRFKVSYEPENTTDPKKTVWSVSDGTKADIDEYGRLIAIAPGDITVYARCMDITAECQVHISRQLNTIRLEKTTVTLAREKAMRIPVIFEPENFTEDRTVYWSSSDPNIAAADEKTGLITAISPGRAVITASCGELTASCEVQVTVPAESLSISQKECSAAIGEKVYFSAFINPYDTTESQSINWSSSDTKVASVTNNGQVECLSEGTAMIRASHGSYSAFCTLTVYDPTGESVNIPKHEEGCFDGRIFIGDSRFVGLEKSVALLPGERVISKGGESFTWFASNALTELRSILAENPYYQVVINMGLNDCANNCAGWTAYYVNNYIDLINQLVSQYPDTEFWFASIGFTDGPYGGAGRSFSPEELRPYIDIFNGMMEVQCRAKFIDLAEYIEENGIRTADGVHYDTGSNLMIYRFISDEMDAEREHAKE